MVVDQAEFGEQLAKLSKLYQDASDVLAGLDELGLYQAGGYLCMAMEVMRQAHPDLTKPG